MGRSMDTNYMDIKLHLHTMYKTTREDNPRGKRKLVRGPNKKLKSVEESPNYWMLEYSQCSAPLATSL